MLHEEIVMPIFAPILAALNAVFTGLLALSIVVIECLIGGTRLVFSLPAYGLVAAAAILSIGALRKDSARPNLTCLAATGILGAYMLVRAAASPWDYLWWTDFFQLLATLTVYLLTVLHLTQTQYRLWIVGILMMLAAGEFFIGLQQFRSMDDWMPFQFITRAPSGARASGTLISSIHFAGLLEAIGPFALAMAFWSRWTGWARALAGYTAVLCYAGVAISGSRGGYLSSLFSLGVFAVLSLASVKRTRPQRFRSVLMTTTLLATAGLVGIVVLMQQSPMMRKRLELLSNQDLRIVEYASARGAEQKQLPGMDIRVDLWKAALDQFRLAPVFGTGAGTYLYYGRLYRRETVQNDPLHVHSDYLELLAEYGIAGGVVMLILLASHIRAGLQRLAHIVRTELGDLDDYRPARSNELALIIGALSAVSAYLAHSAVDFNLHIPGHAMIFGFIFGILASPRGDNEPVSPRAEMAARFALPAIGIWLAILGLGKFTGEFWSESARQEMRARHFPEAIADAARALARERRNPDLYFHNGEAHRGLAAQIRDPAEKKQLLNRAVDSYRNSLAIFPLDVHVLIRHGQALDELGRYAEAREAYDRAIEHDPKLGVLRLYLAQHLYRVGRNEAAEEQIKEGTRLSTKSARTVVDPAFLDAPKEPPRPEGELE
jgi:O-antigen ligase